MIRCSQCDRSFHSTSDLNAHCRTEADHLAFYCETCSRPFAREVDLEHHLRNALIHQGNPSDHAAYDNFLLCSEDGGPEPYCTICSRWFASADGLYTHLAESKRHNWCFICWRDFATQDFLEQHHASPAHGVRDIHCPLCKATFQTLSSIALHIESGECHKIPRHQTSAAVPSPPTAPIISLPHSAQARSSLTPRAITTNGATEIAFNGIAYECCLCHRTFKTLGGLDAHLGSAAHDRGEHKCPKCEVVFMLVSGLVQHVESEECGLVTFEKVHRQARPLTGQFARMMARITEGSR